MILDSDRQIIDTSFDNIPISEEAVIKFGWYTVYSFSDETAFTHEMFNLYSRVRILLRHYHYSKINYYCLWYCVSGVFYSHDIRTLGELIQKSNELQKLLKKLYD